jgi:hypothetical protein
MVSQVLIDKVAESQFNGLPEWQVANILNAPDASLPKVKQDIKPQDLRLAFFSAIPAIKRLVHQTYLDSADPNVRALAEVCSLAIESVSVETREIIFTSNPETFAQLEALSQVLLNAGLISTDIRNAVLSLPDKTVSWAEANNLPPVTSRDVGLARGAS